MERIIKKIEEVKNNLGGAISICYLGNQEADRLDNCGGTFDIDGFSISKEKNDYKFMFSSSTYGRNSSCFYMYPNQYSRVEERLDSSSPNWHTYYLTLETETSHTTGYGIIIEIFEYTRVADIRTFFKWIKKKFHKH